MSAVIHLLKEQHWTGRVYGCGATLPREAYSTRDAAKSTRDPSAVTCPGCLTAMQARPESDVPWVDAHV